MLSFWLVCLGFSGVLWLAFLVVSSRVIVSRSKSTPFECGFEPRDSARVPFSMRFFLLAIVFLIFDIEVALLFPMIFSVSMGFGISFFVGFCFLFILFVGLLHEWSQGSLSWVNCLRM